MYLKDALNQLNDLYEDRMVIHCFARSFSGERGYSLVYYLDGTLYYNAIWLHDTDTAFHVENKMITAARSGQSFDTPADVECLFEFDDGTWDLIEPDHLYEYNLQQFSKEA